MPGAYTETGGSFTAANLTIVGAGAGTVTLTMSAALTLSGAHLTLSGLTVATSGFALTLSGQYATVTESTFTGNNAYIIFGGAYANVTNCRFLATASAAVVQHTAAYHTVDNNYYSLSLTYCPIRIAAHTTFSNNVFLRYDTNGSSGVVQPAGYGCVVVGNVFVAANNGAGIDLTASSPGTIIANNYFDQFATFASTGDSNTTFTGNFWRGSSAGNTILNISFGSYHVVKDNQIINSGSAGTCIQVASGSNYCKIGGNTIKFASIFAGAIGVNIAGNGCNVVDNYIENLASSITVASGATSNIVSLNNLNGYTTAISDSGTTTTKIGNTSDVYSTLPSVVGTSAAPTIVLGSAAGAGATVAIVGTNLSGKITLTSGTGVGTGTVLTMTFSGALAFPNGCSISFAAGNSSFAGIVSTMYVTDTTTTVTLSVTAALALSTVYIGYYSVLGY